jgi:putative transposase
MSVSSRGDSYNSLAELVIGVFKTEVTLKQGPWKNLADVECANLECVDQFNHERVLESIGHVPPAEPEEEHFREAALRDDQAVERCSPH